jgi:hypothetical protein
MSLAEWGGLALAIVAENPVRSLALAQGVTSP